MTRGSCDRAVNAITIRTGMFFAPLFESNLLFTRFVAAFFEVDTMSSSDVDQQSSPCHEGNGKYQSIAPCSCCMALAQVRMPQYATAPTAQSPSENASGIVSGHRKKTLFDLFSIRGNGHSKSKSQRSQANGEKQSNEGEKDSEAEWDTELLGPKARQLWQGLDGMAVFLFGIVVPALLFFATCLSMPKRVTLVLINHPVETIAEVLLVVALPLINYIVWAALCRNNFKYSRIAPTILGAAVASGLIVSAICIAGMFCGNAQMLEDSGTNFAGGFSWLAFLSLMGATASSFIIYRVRSTREFSATKRQVLICSAIGALLAVGVFVAAEARPWFIRYAEYLAVSPTRDDAQRGLKLLRQIYPERELHMECADARAAGLSGLFIQIKPGAQRQLYFAITGKPYSFHETTKVDLSSMPDDYVRNNIVGEEITGLSLARSTMTSNIHPRTMSAAMFWTFVFKNDTSIPQEARAQIALPPGAVVTGVTTWSKGQTMDAMFFASGKIEGVGGNEQIGHDSPATVADLGHGRVLMHAYPVPAEDEYKVRVSIVAPLGAESPKSGSLTFPKFVATNFGLAGEHQLTVQSPENMTSTMKSLSMDHPAAKQYVLSGTLSEENLKSSTLKLTINRPASEPVAIIDRLASKMAREEQIRQAKLHQQSQLYKVREIAELKDLRDRVLEVHDGAVAIEQQMEDLRKTLHRRSSGKSASTRYDLLTVERVSAAAPEKLVVVLDGSATTGEYVKQIRTALQKLPAHVPATLIIASQENQALATPVPLEKGLELLKPESFVGGQDNLKSVVKAAELAGRTKGGAVLWIHGPQPTVNHEIYIMAPYAQAPAFYEMTLGTADIDTLELFSNHPELGPFTDVPRNSKDLGDDLTTFFSHWAPGNSNYIAKLTQTDIKPAKVSTLSLQEENEMVWLHASKQCEQLIASKHLSRAATLAARYGFVSPVSYASVDPNRQNRDVDSGIGSSLSNEAGNPFQGVDANFTAVGGTDAFSADDGSMNSKDAPMLQGATNGTIGPQGGDATVIQGVNTAGTVRVNNLANLEALLNIIANLVEVGLAVCGAIFVLCGLIEGGTSIDVMGQEVEVTRGQRLFCGATMVVLGLMTPGLINWFVASARDANLFS
jgi:hypothetical protein